jgi:hypothetical protein
MLTFYKTQDSKPTISDKKGNAYIDFLQKDLVVSTPGSDLSVIDYFLVTQDESMRPDLITKKMYGYLDNIEGVLKFNDISNPFSIDEGDILYTYDIPSMERNLRPGFGVENDRQDVRDQYITPEKGSTVDPALRTFEKRDTPRTVNPAKGNQPALPPNYAAFGDTELQIRNGKIVFGAGVTKQEDDCDKPLSKSEFISRLIKNRLSNGTR